MCCAWSQKASKTVLSPQGGFANYFSSLRPTSGRGFGECCSGNPLFMLAVPDYLRGLLKFEAFFKEAKNTEGPPIGELFSRACHVAKRGPKDLDRCSDD